jgi:hypothetical protein
MPFGNHKEIWRKIGVAKKGPHTINDVSRIKIEGLPSNDDLRSFKFRASGKFLIDNLVQLSRSTE